MGLEMIGMRLETELASIASLLKGSPGSCTSKQYMI